MNKEKESLYKKFDFKLQTNAVESGMCLMNSGVMA